MMNPVTWAGTSVFILNQLIIYNPSMIPTDLSDWFVPRGARISQLKHSIAGDIGASANTRFLEASQVFPFPPIPRRNILSLASYIEDMSCSLS